MPRKAGPGRPKGTPNKRTVQKMVEASQRVGEIKRQGQKRAVEVLNDLMQTSMSFAASYQKKILDAGPSPAKDDLEWFWKAMECAGAFAKALAPYQDAQFKAIMVMPAAAAPAEPKVVDGKVLRLDDPVAAAKIYQQMVRRIA